MPRILCVHSLRLLAASLLLATTSQADCNAGNYRRGQDEASRQRAAEQVRRNEEMRNGSLYPSPGAVGGYSSGSGASSSVAPSLPVLQSQPSGPPSIERTETVTVRAQETQSEAVARLLREAEDGHANAALAYGEMLFNGKGVAENPVEAGKWFRIAAEKGVPRAMFLWGTLLEIGYGTARDLQAAFVWVKRAAEAGEMNAYEPLAAMYRAGRGTVLDVAEGLRWLRKGAEQGDARSSYELGSLHFNGDGVSIDEAEAARWFLKSAEQGHPEGMFNAGIMHEQGLLGIAVNRDMALKWYRQAAAKNSADARTALQRLGY